MKEKQVKVPGPDHPISIQRNPARVVVSVAGRVILQYVAERPGLFIKWPPSLDTVGFRERKLYPLNVVPIPDRLEDSIAETKEENVLHRLFAEIVIDPKYLILRKDRVHIVI